MWCGIRSASTRITAICLVVFGIVTSSTAIASRKRDYTAEEFCSVLRGLGYQVDVSDDCLQSAQGKKAVSEFQKGYKLGVDSTTGSKTQNHAADIVEILQANLNMVVKPEPPLPRNQFYGPQTAAAVSKYQEKLKVEQTGIADLALRQKLDKEVKEMLDIPTSKPEATTAPKPGETSTPEPGGANTTPKPGEVTTPNTGETSTPNPGATSTPKPEATSNPKPGEVTTPNTEETSTPDPGATGTPNSEATSSPNPEVTSSPNPEATSNSKPEATSNPKPGEVTTPNTGETSTPKPEATSNPNPEATPKQ